MNAVTITDRDAIRQNTDRGQNEPPIETQKPSPTQQAQQTQQAEQADRQSGDAAADVGGEAIEIELKPEDLGEQPAAETAERKKANRVPRHERIDQLTQRASQAERAVHEARQQAATIQQQLEQARQQTRLADHKSQLATYAANVHYENRLKDQAERAQNDIEAAGAAGDPKLQAEATKRLTEAQAKLAQVETWKAQNPPPRPGAVQAPATQTQPAQTRPTQTAPMPELAPRALKWVADNPYFDQRHPGFNDEMAKEAARLGGLLEARYHREGRAEDIGNDAYFEAIDRHMQQKYPEYFDDGESAQPQASPFQRRPPGLTTGVSRPTAGQAATGQTGGVRVTLSAEEREYARSLGLKDPATGRQLTAQELEQRYALRKHEDMRRQQRRG